MIHVPLFFRYDSEYLSQTVHPEWKMFPTKHNKKDDSIKQCEIMYPKYKHNKPLIKTFVAGHSVSLSLRVQDGMACTARRYWRRLATVHSGAELAHAWLQNIMIKSTAGELKII